MKKLSQAYQDMVGTRMASNNESFSPEDKEKTTLTHKQRVINKLLRVLRETGNTKAQLAELLLDEREIFREVAKIRLEEMQEQEK